VSISLRVLILEDRSEDAELMIQELRHSDFDPEWVRVDTESEYNARLDWPPDVILANCNLPLLDAFRALEFSRQRNLSAIPFIVVSEVFGEDRAVTLMDRGATDYLLKDRLARLGPAVRRALGDTQLRDEIRRAEQALRASDVRFSSFMNNSQTMAFIKDQQGRILYINNTCERIWGVTLTDCFGKTNQQLWPPEVADRLRANDMAVIERNESSQLVEELSLKNGRAVALLTVRFPFADGDGRRLLGGVSVDISEQVRTQEALAAALATKELLLKEVHHRVKNNLQIISSLLSMQSESLQDLAAARALQNSQERVQCMALIHERLHLDAEPDRLDFREYAVRLARDLFYSYGVDSERIQLRFELEPILLGLNQAIPCGLILNELLTNSLKYAFPNERAGEVLVKLSFDEDETVKLTVADNGVGLAAAFDWKESQSLGLRIMNILARQLDGTVQREPGAGTAFSWIFRKTALPEPAAPVQVATPPDPEPSTRKSHSSISKLGHTA
jgi:PAS domain S-box-containing protein